MPLIFKVLRPHGPTIFHYRQRLIRRKTAFSVIRYPSTEKSPILRFLAKNWQYTHDPIWAVAKKLSEQPTPSLKRVLARQGITRDEYLKWSNLNALRELQCLPPPWVLIRALVYHARNPSQARAICETVLSHLSSVPPGLLPSFLILCVHILANHQVLSSVRTVILAFLQIPPPILYFQYHLLLRAISRFIPSAEITALIFAILDNMIANQIVIRVSTFAALLESRARTVTLARRVENLMASQKIIPTAEVYHALFRMFAKGSSTSASSYHLRNSKTYTTRLKRVRIRQQSSRHDIADTLILLGSLRDMSGTFKQLQAIFKEKPAMLESLGIRGWTSILSLSARTHQVTADDLLKLFSNIQEAFEPTVVTYTVLIRALSDRNDFDNARAIWGQFLNSGLALDIKSLSAGVEAMTLAGSLLEAFRLLEEFAARPRSGGRHVSSRPRISLTPAFINSFMEALLRINRPDVVFALWDHAEILYGVMPDSSTLNILLSTARSVGKFEQNFHGFWDQLRAQVSTTSHSDAKSFSPKSRSEAVQLLEEMSSDQPVRLTGMWNGAPAWQKAVRIFCHAILGNNPQLLHVSAPATAIRSSMDEIGRHPLKELSRNIFGRNLDVPFHQNTHVDLDSPTALARLGIYPLGAYPKIFPTKITFHNYIYLLGLNNQASQIPITMTWMRELNIFPMKMTISMALIFWAEVSLQAPLFDQFACNGEYAAFVRWFENWVGLVQMPGPSVMTKVSRMIAWARQGHDYAIKRRR